MKNDFIEKPDGISDFWWLFMLHKRYFDTGYSMTGYIKYIVALFGLSSLNVGKTLIMGFAYAFLCWIVGWAWYKYRFAELDTEIGNRINLFVREMREMREKMK